MPEIRQEVIITTAAILSALITYISIQTYYNYRSEKDSKDVTDISGSSSSSIIKYKSKAPIMVYKSKDSMVDSTAALNKNVESSDGIVQKIIVDNDKNEDDKDKKLILQGRKIEGTSIDSIFLHDIRSLRDTFHSAGIPTISTPGFQPYNKILGREDFIIADIVRKHSGHGTSDAFVR
jgi:hypothetical protein